MRAGGENKVGWREGGVWQGQLGAPDAEPLLAVMLGKCLGGAPGGACLPRASPGVRLRASGEASLIQVEVSADPQPQP